MIARRSAVSVVVRKRARFRVRAASSSSSWEISARLKPASSRRLLDELQALDIVVVIEAVVAIAPGGRREEADLLVVADRPRRQAERRRDLLDPQEGRSGAAVAVGWSRWLTVRSV